MKKNKHLLLVLPLLIIGINHIKAETLTQLRDRTFDLSEGVVIGETTESCQNESDAGKYYDIKWDGGRETLGAVYTCYREIDIVNTDGTTVTGDSSTSRSTAISNATNACEELRKAYRKPACCDWKGDPKKGESCSGSKACTPPSCSTPTCTSKTTTSGGGGNSGGDSGGGSGGGGGGGGGIGFDPVNMLNKIAPIIPIRKFVTDYKIKEKQVVDVRDDGGGGGGGTTTTTYTCTATYNEVKITYSDKCKDGTNNISVPSYEIDGNGFTGDPSYCLQPGANGPTADGLKYTLEKTFDISDCQDQYINQNDQNDIKCGLAQLLYLAHNCDANGCTKKYSDGVITLALRLWMASYAKTAEELQTYPSLLTNPGTVDEDGDTIFNESSPLAWIPSEDYYQVTSNLIKNGKTYDVNYKAITRDKVKGRIGCTSDEDDAKKSGKINKCAIEKAIDLFHATENVKKEDYLGGINFNKKVPVIEYREDLGDFDIIFDDPGTFKKVTEHCTDMNDPECKIKIRLFYGDKDVTDSFEIGPEGEHTPFCTKNTCTAKITKVKEFCVGGGYTKITAVVIIDKWERNYGFIRFYTHSGSSAKKYQKMVSFGIEQEKCETQKIDTTPARIEGTIKVPCDCPVSTCDDLSGIETGGGECASEKTIKDANMNCIVNSCEVDKNIEFNVTDKYGANPLVCTIYERDETEIYLPGATTVYAGMQFEYDLAKELKDKLSGLDTKHKLTAVVIQKKQITSKINYDYWEREYNRKMELLNYSYNMGYSDTYKNALKKEISDWIYDLKNCNFYNNESNSRDVVDAINSTVKSGLDCTGSTCANVSFSYDDSNYGAVRNLGHSDKYIDISIPGATKVELKNNGKVEGIYNLYYCTNSESTKCYNYNQNNPVAVEIVQDNNEDEIKYYTCSSSCSNTKTTIPKNNFATIIMNVEHDYYSAKKYKVQAYTGKVVEGELTSEEKKALDKGQATYLALSDYTYPTTGSSKTQKYNVHYFISNIKSRNRKDASGQPLTEGNKDKYNASCYYQLYNRTTAYDCKALDKNGNIDLSKCQDTAYDVVNGVPKIEGFDQVKWTDETGNLQYGYIYRSVDLDNLFPNGLESLNSAVNWSDAKEEIENIERSADTIFSDSTYLEYSYTITPQGMQEIRSYNDNHNVDGGYLNSTLVNCAVEEDETGLNKFTECKSTFLEEIRGYAGVTVNKDGEVR